MTQAISLRQTKSRRISPTFSSYVARQYVLWLLTMILALAGVILLVTIVDLVDRLTNKAGMTLGTIVELAFLKLPYLNQEVMPFTILFAAMITLWRLTRSHELVVARAAGISIWGLMFPILSVAVFVGLLSVSVMNPLASLLLSRFETVESRYLNDEIRSLAISRTGLWLRQADQVGHSVIHAQRVSQDSMVLHDVIVFRFADEDRFVLRIDADNAELRDGHWFLQQAWTSEPGQQPQYSEGVAVDTELTATKIQEGFAPPETISFWNLPEFIDLLENAGFSAQRHRLQWHRLLAMPILFSAMVLLAATFSLRPQRRGHVGFIILAGVLCGFLLYFLSNFASALGMSGKIPVMLAAWTPAGTSMMLGIAMLLHLEDG